MTKTQAFCVVLLVWGATANVVAEIRRNDFWLFTVGLIVFLVAAIVLILSSGEKHV